MWPWEHLAVGYLALTAERRARRGRPPGEAEALVLAVGTQAPDLVDKPLAWTFDVLPGGLSLAHSALVAGPVLLVVLAVGRRLDRGTLAGAFALGYVSHLAGDVFAPVLYGRPPAASAVLWPLVAGPSPPRRGLLDNVRYYLDSYWQVVSSPRGWVTLAAGVATVVVALAIWRRDGYPGLGVLLDRVRSGREPV